MSSYSYTAVSGGIRKRGYIEAGDETHARKLLLSLGLQVEEVKQGDPDATSLPSFRFRAKKKTGEEVMGVVEAFTREGACARLRDEYDLEVGEIHPHAAGVRGRPPLEASPPPPHEPPTCLPAGRPRGEASSPKGRTINPFIGISEDTDRSESRDHRQLHAHLPVLRFTSGWLLSFYGVAVTIGYYEMERIVSVWLPRFTSLLSSPWVFLFLLSLGLFLLLSGIHTESKMQKWLISIFGVLMVVFAAMAF